MLVSMVTHPFQPTNQSINNGAEPKKIIEPKKAIARPTITTTRIGGASTKA